MTKTLTDYAWHILNNIEESPDGCWLWKGYTLPGRGYGQVGQNLMAHRVVWQYLRGPIPEGLTLDHECHNRDLTCNAAAACLHRRCVNPRHLVPRTIGANTMHGRTISAINAAKTHCAKNHPFTPANTYYRPDRYGRICRTCRDAALARIRQDPDYRARNAARERRRRAAAAQP